MVSKGKNMYISVEIWVHIWRYLEGNICVGGSINVSDEWERVCK